ncbi:hypothetical protein [Thermogladius sp.]|uniref:hypothetical protein n=1 Tax=Thermogladius sp. TaxID=2023064 RepID=UPI003D0F84FB
MSVAKSLLRHWAESEEVGRGSGRAWLYLKTAYFIATLGIGYFNNVVADVLNLLLSAALLVAGGCLDLLAYSLAVFLPAGGVMLGLSYSVHGYTPAILHNYLFGYNTFLSLMLVVATTSPRLLVSAMDRVGLGLAIRLMKNVVWELDEVLDSKRSRGIELRWSLRGQLVGLFDATKVLARRLGVLESSLKARGFD